MPTLYISADMEGLAGSVTADQLGPQGFEYNEYRRLMTLEVVAAIEGAREAGAERIVVADAHGNGLNLLPDLLPEDVRLVRSWPRPLQMMEGIDATFDGAMLIGYHTGATHLSGVRAHTFSSALLTDVRLNGESVCEAVYNAAVAGHFGVPVIMFSGDDAAATQACGVLGPVETAVVKQALGFHAASTLTPAAARTVIAGAARRAVARLGQGEFVPYRVESPVQVEVHFKHYRPVELLAYLPFFERPAARVIRYQAADMPEATQILVFLLNYEAGMAP